MTEGVKFALDVLATGSISMTLARSRMFREVRWWAARHGGDFVWDLLKCVWCVSHWVAFGLTAAFFPDLLFHHPLLWFAIAMAVVAIAPVAGFMVHRIYGVLPAVPTEQEWNYTDLGPEEEQHDHTEVRT